MQAEVVSTNQPPAQVGNYLKDTWAITLKNSIKSSFKDVGKVRVSELGARLLA